MIDLPEPSHDIATEVRVKLFRTAVETGRVPQAPELSRALGRPESQVRAALRQLAAARVLMLAPNDGEIWAASPFCATPSGFRVSALGHVYWGICIWDALGIAAALDAATDITASCGDCGASMRLQVRHGALSHAEGVVHFAVPARHWWDNIGFT
jgi:hypothetical protein